MRSMCLLCFFYDIGSTHYSFSARPPIWFHFLNTHIFVRPRLHRELTWKRILFTNLRWYKPVFRYVRVYAFLLLWNSRVNYDRPIEGTPANGILDSRYAFRVPHDTQISPSKSRLPRSVQLREGRKKLAISRVKHEHTIESSCRFNFLVTWLSF